MVGILSDRRELIVAAVQAMYSEVARRPGATFHFPTGLAACRLAGYPQALLDTLPADATESFAGVGYPFAAGVIEPGDTVLDVGAGSGTDVLAARSLVGRQGRVIGIDLTRAMLDKLRRVLAASDAANVRLTMADAEALPLAGATIDVVTSNGVLNLVPDKYLAFREIARVLRPGGWLQIADIALAQPVSDECRADPQLWAECVVGATLESEYVRLLRDVGFTGIERLGAYDYFAASASPETRAVAASFGARAITLRARKPPVGS
jgi:arsenite methyltransferase